MNFTFPSFSQWKQIFKVLKKGEKIALLIFAIAAVASFLVLAINVYLSNTNAVPTLGGTYIEGAVGQPRFINPIYGETNDTDRALIDLVFSGLMTYDKEGKIVKDLADRYTVSNDGRTYDFTLKNATWHDGKPLTADDIVFTIKTIQNSDYKSPLRANWIGVDVQKVSDRSVRFVLKTPYNSFLENCTLKIIPEHIWGTILPENFALSAYNLQPIGSGPFAFSSIHQDNRGFINTLDLASNRKYYGNLSLIATISFHFFEKKEELEQAAKAGSINGFTLAALDNNEAEAEQSVKAGWSANQKFLAYSFSLPRYFAVFFNTQKTSLFADKNIRKAFSYATDKAELVTTINTQMKGHAIAIDSPILPNFFDYQKPTTVYTFDLNLAKSLLDKSGFKEGDQGARQKVTNKKPAFQFKSYLKLNSKGTEVTQLQACLVKLDDTFKQILAGETNGTYGKATQQAVSEFQKKYLPDTNPTGETGTGTRAKLNQLCLGPSTNSTPLKLTLTTVNQPQLIQVANLLKQYWQSVGAQVTINAVSLTDLKQVIKSRNYDALLYGEALGAKPDFYPFWHSSQRLDPGLNLSSYENKQADQLLKDSRETMDLLLKEQKLEKLQDIIIDDAPALFLYNPDYLYWVSSKVQGIDTEKIIDPAKRFSNITNWYLQTKRVWK